MRLEPKLVLNGVGWGIVLVGGVKTTDYYVGRQKAYMMMMMMMDVDRLMKMDNVK